MTDEAEMTLRRDAPLGDRCPAGTIAAVEGGRRLLGLTLLERLVLTARRVGIVDIVVVASSPDHARLRSAADVLPDSAFVDALPVEPCALPTGPGAGDALGETAWLAATHAIADCSRGDPARRMASGCSAPASCRPIPRLHQRVRSLALDLRPLRLRRMEDLAAAEQRLLQGLRKETDGYTARVVARPLSIAVSRRLVSLGVSPNQMTLVSMSIGLAAAFFFLSPDPIWQLIGSLLFVAHSVLDGCDGELRAPHLPRKPARRLARLRRRQPRPRGGLRLHGDRLELEADAAWPLLFGLGALIGTIGSASAVYWLTLRHKTGDGLLYTSTTGTRTLYRGCSTSCPAGISIYPAPFFAAFGKGPVVRGSERRRSAGLPRPYWS